MAPFLRFDSDPYPIVADGHVFWIINAYTTTADYPYSQSVSTQLIGSDLSRGYNYVRNSVKVVVDAYNGNVDMYVTDESDPMIRAWRGAFPDLFTDESEVPEEIRSHFRYPSDLFTVQTDMWSDYVVDDPTDFIQGNLAWSVAAQPQIEAESEESDTVAAPPMAPQYLMARPPGAEEAEFVLQRAFVPQSGVDSNTTRPELTGLMMARSDPENYGELILVTVPLGQIDAPDLVHAQIRQSPVMTAFVLEKRGAKVEFGEMSIVLVDDTIVYIRPVYVESNSQTAIPELQRVVAVNGDRIFMDSTIGGAIRGVVGNQTTAGPEPPSTDGEEPEASVDTEFDTSEMSVVDLVALAATLLSQADSLEATSPDEADVLREQARIALDEAQNKLGGVPPTAPAESSDT